MGGGHGGHGHYPGYPTDVWSPSGGWYADPKYWRRNTLVAIAAITAICIPIAITSARLEVMNDITRFLKNYPCLYVMLLSLCRNDPITQQNLFQVNFGLQTFLRTLDVLIEIG